MNYRTRVIETCTKFMSPEAAEVVGVLLSSFAVADNAFKNDTPSDDDRMAVVQMFVDLTTTLPLSTWWQNNGRMVAPLLWTSIGAWFDVAAYIKGVETDPIRAGKAISTRSMRFEIATAVLLADKGAIVMREKSVELRDALMQLGGV